MREEKESDSGAKATPSRAGRRVSVVEQMKAFEEAVVCIQRAWRGHDGKRKFNGIVDALLEEDVEIPKRKKIVLDDDSDEEL